MKMKQWIAGLLSAVMLFALTGNFASAAERSADGYHYSQLNSLARTIYDGIGQMDLTTGTDEYDLAADLRSIPSNTALNQAMNAARYAYYADHPEVFYVNFPNLTLRSTQGTDGSRHIYIGSGRNASYLLDAFEDQAAVKAAMADFDRQVLQIVGGANQVEPDAGESLQAAQIRYVHDEIIHNVSYRLEDTAAYGNAALLGSPYGVLVKKQGVCEGYARAFKTVMDYLEIPCILVQGVHQYDGELAVNHMWNYVEITDGAAARAGGRWYAVDATLDDPEVPVASSAAEYSKYHTQFDQYGEDGFEQEKYLLVGQLTMNEKHFEAEEVAAAGGYRFAYPALEEYDFMVTGISNDLDGFKVIAKDVPGSASETTITEYQFSYLGMTVSEARAKGIYLVWRYYKEENSEIVPVYNQYGSWFYIDPAAYTIKEENGYSTVQEGTVPYVEIAATTVPPEADPPASKPFAELTYQGDDAGLIARTGKIYNKNQSNYTPPPFVVKQTPTQTATINLSNHFYHITAEFDETLAAVDGAAIGTRIECRDRYGAAVTGAERSTIRNFTWDGDKTVSFDMEFSKMFADSNVIYNIYLEGLVGETSQKTPNPIVYTTRQKTACPCVMERDGNWDLFGKPTLLERSDLSTENWRTSNGQPVSDLLTHRLTLVTTKTTEAQDAQIAEQVEHSVSDNILGSETYNISLSVCKTMIVETGDKVKVRLGFPAGYGPDDEGVTFKAYHFSRDSQGNVTGVEEIGCVVTQYGLIITCDAFSPFMIAAVEQDEAAAASRTAVVTASDGGTVSGADAAGLVTLEQGGSQTLTFTAQAGYQLESVTVCGREIALEDSDSATVTVSYDEINDNNIINASFVATEVAEKEAAKNEAPVQPEAQAAEISVPGSRSVSEGDSLIITATVAEQADSVQSFQWYKDGQKLEGKTSKRLAIQNAGAADAGRYTLTVTTTVGTVSAEAQSSPCTVTVQQRAAVVPSQPQIPAAGKDETQSEAPVQAPAFTDVAQDAYYYDAVAWAVKQGITSGATDTTFAPNTVCTRAQMVTFLWRAAGSPKATGSNPFTDLQADAYYYDAVLWAVEQGITSGATDTTFAPNASCTRAQAVTFLWRANGAPTAAGGGFTDVADTAYYVNAVAWARTADITSGTGDGCFSPDALCSRGQVVTFLYRDHAGKA